jgi:hypothetical protein
MQQQSADARFRGGSHGHTKDAPVTIDLAEYHMLHPLSFGSTRAGRADPAGDHPGGRQIAFLPEIGPQHPHIEVLPLDAAKPPVERPQRGVNGNRLMVVAWRAGPDRTGIHAVLPEQRPHPAPIAAGEAPRIAVEQALDDVLVAASTGGGTVLDAAPRQQQETEPERRELSAA